MATLLRVNRSLALGRGRFAVVPCRVPCQAVHEHLRFPLEAVPYLTPFRRYALELIFNIALEKMQGAVTGATVSVKHVPGELDSYSMSLAIQTNLPGAAIPPYRKSILRAIASLATGWSPGHLLEYSRRIYFCVDPR